MTEKRRNPLIPSGKNTIPVSRVATTIVAITDSYFIDNIRQLYDALGLPSSEYGRLKLQYTLGVENYYGLISKILTDWVSSLGPLATTSRLINVLKHIECIAVAGTEQFKSNLDKLLFLLLSETLESKFPKSCQLIVSQSSASSAQGSYRIPIFFQIALFNHHFIGRKSETNQLLQNYREFRQSSDSIGVNIITGPSGVGKSALARHFCHQTRQLWPGHSCIWIWGDSPSDTKLCLAEIAKYLEVFLPFNSLIKKITPNFTGYIQVAEKKPDSTQDMTSIHAKHNGTPIILVISNVRMDNEVVRRLLSNLHQLPAPKVFVVMTSTYLDIPGIIGNEIALSPFTKEDGNRLITSISKYSQPLLPQMWLPLTTVMLAKYYKNHGHDTLHESDLSSAPNLCKIILHNTLKLVKPDLSEVVCGTLNILVWIIPSSRIKLQVLKDMMQANFRNVSESLLLTGLALLQDASVIEIHPMFFNSPDYPEADEFTEKYVEMHPTIRSQLQEMLVVYKSNTIKRFLVKFGKLDKSSQNYFVTVKEDLLRQNLELKGTKEYYNLENSLLLAENPSDIFIPRIRKLTVFSLLGFFITLINLIVQVVTSSTFSNWVDICFSDTIDTESES